jgi:hypothetical protein
MLRARALACSPSFFFSFFVFLHRQQACFLALLLVLVAGREGLVRCRTRTVDEQDRASKTRVVWTPMVRLGAQVANTFFNAAEASDQRGVWRAFFLTM